MKKYKVLKSWFTAKEGEILKKDTTGGLTRDSGGEIVVASWEIDQALQEGWIEPLIDNENWRAPVGEDYYLIDRDIEVLCLEDSTTYQSDNAYKAGNYFKSKETAESVQEALNLFFEFIHAPVYKEISDLWHELGRATGEARKAVIADESNQKGSQND